MTSPGPSRDRVVDSCLKMSRYADSAGKTIVFPNVATVARPDGFPLRSERMAGAGGS